MAEQPVTSQPLVTIEATAATATVPANVQTAARIITPVSNDASWLYAGLEGTDVRSLQMIGLVFAFVSLVASCVSVYWLVRMHRGFRHDLIILLIASDLIKSLSLVIYNIVSLSRNGTRSDYHNQYNKTDHPGNKLLDSTHTHIPSSSAFCQLSGFIFAAGIEGADAAVFFISLHSTVHIFWPNRAGGESGLYPYRRWTYIIFSLWAPFMASLAFVGWHPGSSGGSDGGNTDKSSSSSSSSTSSFISTPGYVNTGQACYLPSKPWWYRTALSWIPRYTILSVIVLMYGSSYIYVRVMIRRYSRRDSSIEMAMGGRQRSSGTGGSGGGTTSHPPTPPLDRHSLVPAAGGSESSRRSSKAGAAAAAAACDGGSTTVDKSCSPAPPPPPVYSNPRVDSPSFPRPAPAVPISSPPKKVHKRPRLLDTRRLGEYLRFMRLGGRSGKVNPLPGPHELRARHRQHRHRQKWTWDGFNEAPESLDVAAGDGGDSGGAGAGGRATRIPSPAVVSPGTVTSVTRDGHHCRLSSFPSTGRYDEAGRGAGGSQEDTSRHQEQQQHRYCHKRQAKDKQKQVAEEALPSPSPSPSPSPLSEGRPSRSFYKRTLSASNPGRLQTPISQHGRSSPDFYRRPISFSTVAGLAIAAGNTEKQTQEREGMREDAGDTSEQWKSNDGDFTFDPGFEGRNRLVSVSQVHISTMLRQGPPIGRTSAKQRHHQREEENADDHDDDHDHRGSVGSVSPIVALDQEAFDSGGLSKSRDRLRRQLRLLFVYPAVYVCVWVFPFTVDVVEFSSPVGRFGPYWMLICTLLSLSLQGLFDSLVFCTRERPWRHMRGGFWENSGLGLFKNCKFTLRKSGGRTREEMFNDSAHARNRRDGELEREHEFRDSRSGRMPPTAGGSNWWDVEEGGSAGRSGHGHKHQDKGERAQTSSEAQEGRETGK